MKAVRAKPGLFRDRREAGRLLAEKLAAYADRSDVLVLALPRGGVPVAYEVARALGAPLDVFVVRKLGVPGYEELAMGAVATGGVRVLNEQLVERLGIPEQMIDAVAARERQELARRERLYRGGRPPPDVRSRTVILVDDGQWGNVRALGEHTLIPFLEKDGQYWGPAPDDETAIRELERLLREGASYLVFAWPSFWWLEHYTGLHNYVRRLFPCILENERLIVFELKR